MAFDPVLMIMQPRQIDESLNSLKENIDIPKVWFRAYTEPQVMVQMNKFIKETEFSHYIVMGDDAVVSRKAADTILKYGEMKEHQVFTGWMNQHLEEDGSYSKESTVCHGWFPIMKNINGPSMEDYPPWTTVEEMKNSHKKTLVTSMATFAMSMAKRDLFLEFPLIPHKCGKATDHAWSYTLQRAGVIIWTHPDAFIKHLRQGIHPLMQNWLVGKDKPETIYKPKWKSREHYV